MKDSLENKGAATAGISNRQMAEGLRGALEKNYARILCAAESEWEHRFAGKEQSDACVSVRMSDWKILSGAAQSQPTLTSQAA